MLPGIKQFDLTGRTAIVTGGSKGLGAAMAEGLASAGANLVLVSRNQDEVDAVATQIASDYDVKTIGVQADVTKPDEVNAMVEKAVGDFGGVDILIANAGVNIRGPIDELSYEEFLQVQDVNVNGVWLCSKAVVPHMKKAGKGRIVILASTLGLVGLANRTPYATSKGATVQMTRALGLELAPFGGNLEGVRAASLAYFGREPRRLSLGEAALLVALPQSPEGRRPDIPGNRANARAARARVLAQAGNDFRTVSASERRMHRLCIFFVALLLVSGVRLRI